MRRRDVSKALLLTAAGTTAVSSPALSQSSCSPLCYPQVAAEVSAGVTPSDYQYPPGNLRRYHSGGADWASALSQLRNVAAEGMACTIPRGTYAYSTSPNWAIAGLQLTGERGSVLHHTGAGIAFNLDSGATGATVSGLTVSNLTIKGNASTSDGVYSRGIAHSVFRFIEVRDVSAKAFNIRHGVLNHYDTCIVSGNIAAFAVHPTHGFYLDSNGLGYYTATCTFTNCVAEAFNGKGCALAEASGNVFTGGSFEGVLIGLDIDSDSCARNRFVNVWFEANSYADTRVKGTGNNFCNCYFGSPSTQPTVSVITGAATMFEGGFARQIDLHNTSRDTLFVGVVFSDHSALGITGPGSYKMIGGIEANTNGVVTTTLPDVP